MVVDPSLNSSLSLYGMTGLYVAKSKQVLYQAYMTFAYFIAVSLLSSGRIVVRSVQYPSHSIENTGRHKLMVTFPNTQS